MIEQAQIEARIRRLVSERDQLAGHIAQAEEEIAQMKANLSMYNGGISELNQLLAPPPLEVVAAAAEEK